MDQDVKKILGDRLKELRSEANLSQEELSNALQVSKSTISEMERYSKGTSFTVLKKIANYFNVTIDYLLGNSNYKNGRLITIEELRTFLPEDFVKQYKIEFTIDGEEVSEEDKNDIIKILKDKGKLK